MKTSAEIGYLQDTLSGLLPLLKDNELKRNAERVLETTKHGVDEAEKLEERLERLEEENSDQKNALKDAYEVLTKDMTPEEFYSTPAPLIVELERLIKDEEN